VTSGRAAENSPARRPAILLVPGWKDRSPVMEPLAQHLRASGWPDERVTTVAFDDPFGSNREHADELQHALQRLERESGADRIVIVAHSMGGLATRWYLARDPSPKVKAALFLATPHRGTWLAWLGWGSGAGEMRPRSAFMQDLSAAAVPPDVKLICFRAPGDTRLFPASTAWLDGAECRTLPALGHKRILRQQRVFDEVTRTLVTL